MICSNGYDIPAGWGNADMFYGSLIECCQEEFGSSDCPFEDVCTSKVPTLSPLSAVTTAPPTTPRPSFFPTTSPSFGSTPTVSKDTTGPPTFVADRASKSHFGLTRSAPISQKTYTNTECNEVYGGNPRVCVYVCTDIVSVYSGDQLVSEKATSYESECPEGVE
eukprot:scaffold222_cov225-Alexandrium_tamarense.AAC.1